ncbi:MAG: hypothetical protein ABSF51_02600 [Verrucomicrobiota bacterium]|jgi:hypothetical protein
MKKMVRLAVCVWLTTAGAAVPAQETWQGVLGRMPLGIPQSGITELNRTNCVPLMLNAFQSNAVVKALIFMPGATDELYFFRRANAKLTNAHPTLLDAVVALTNQTYVQATFQPPLLLLHTTEDPLDAIAMVKNQSTAAKLRNEAIPDRIIFIDAGWDDVRAVVNKKMSVGLRPFSNTPDSWHFFRLNFAACGVTEWEMLETIALTDKTKFTVHWLTAGFELDRRSGAVPGADKLSEP